MRRWPLAAAVVLAGCGRYADFTLPPLAGGDPSTSFAFEERSGTVIERGAWSDALNPSVVRAPDATLFNFYSVFAAGRWQTALAVSADGLAWQDRGVVLTPDAATWEGSYIAANGSALWFANQYWCWYQAGPKPAPRIGLARSEDARNFRKEPAPVLDYGPYMSWDERAVADPCVLRIGDFFYLYYLGQDRADPPLQHIGLARSTDGIHWTKLRTNPILELGAPSAFDENGLGEPAVFEWHGFYWMLYTGRDRNEMRRLGLARSTDGVHWQKLPVVFAGAEAWDSKVICDPSVLVENGQIRVWFGGGDIASPDENLHGAIGYGTLRPVHATLAP